MTVSKWHKKLRFSVLRIFLRQNLVSQQVNRLDGGLDTLIGRWEAQADDDQDYVRPRQRASIYRWIKNGIPAKGEEVLAICGLVEVDPLAVFDYERNGYFSNFATIRRNVQLGLYMIGALAPIYQLYQPGPFWPSDALAKRYWGRSWFAHEFSNEDDWNDPAYVLVNAVFSEPIKDTPRAVHVAYRRLGSRDTMWRYYGTVIRISDELQLYSESGDFQTMKATQENQIQFRTYFGGRPVEFRIACLHNFKIGLDFPCNDKSIVGFEW